MILRGDMKVLKLLFIFILSCQSLLAKSKIEEQEVVKQFMYENKKTSYLIQVIEMTKILLQI